MFVSERDGSRALWRMDPSGSGQVRLGTDVLNRSPWGPALSADGQWVFFSNDKRMSLKIAVDGQASSAVFEPSAGGSFPVLPAGFHDPHLAPDGRTVAGHYFDAPQRGERIAVVPLADPAKAKLFPSIPNNAQWSPDGRSLLFFETLRGVSNLSRQPIAGGAPVPLTRFDSDVIFHYAMSADGKQLAVARGATISDVVLMTSRAQ